MTNTFCKPCFHYQYPLPGPEQMVRPVRQIPDYLFKPRLYSLLVLYVYAYILYREYGHLHVLNTHHTL